MDQEKHLFLPTFNTIGVSERSDGKIVILQINLSPEEYSYQSPSVQKILGLNTKEKKEVERYLNLDSQTKQMILAFIIANNALYFNDNSDYETALWKICCILNPSLDEYDDYTPQFINKNGL